MRGKIAADSENEELVFFVRFGEDVAEFLRWSAFMAELRCRTARWKPLRQAAQIH